jgi:hypothetical protein
MKKMFVNQEKEMKKIFVNQEKEMKKMSDTIAELKQNQQLTKPATTVTRSIIRLTSMYS